MSGFETHHIKEENPRPSCWLGVSHQIRSELCYSVIGHKGDVFSRTTAQHITEQDLRSDDIHKQFEQLDSSLNECLSDHNFISSDATDMLYDGGFGGLIQ